MADEPISFADRKRASEVPGDPVVARILSELLRMFDSPEALRAAIAKLPTGRVLLLTVSANLEIVSRFGAEVDSTITVKDERGGGEPDDEDEA